MMYTHFNVIEDAELRAEAEAFNDRMRFSKFIEAGEHFIKKNGLIVGGAAATRLLLGNPQDPALPPVPALDTFQYNLFSGRAPLHARALGEILYQLDPEGLSHYTTVLSKVSDYLLTVTVDGRDIFTITALPTHRGVRMSDIMIPSERPAQFAKNQDGTPVQLQCSGPEIQLIDTYATLCNPAKVESWGGLLNTEGALRSLFIHEIGTKFTRAVSRVGGASRQVLKRLTLTLRDKYATGPSRVFIGPAAISLLTGKDFAGMNRLQVITASRLESDAQEIATLIEGAGEESAWKIDDPKIPTDPRLRRMTVYITSGGRRDPILDVYNSAAFDLIPYVTAGALQHGGAARRHSGGAPASLKVGTPFVLMRYRLIDMWTMQVLMRMGVVNATFSESTLNDMLAGYVAAAAYYDTLLADAASNPGRIAQYILPQVTYIGRLEEPELALKRAAQIRSGARFHPPYLPAGHVQSSLDEKKNGHPSL